MHHYVVYYTPCGRFCQDVLANNMLQKTHVNFMESAVFPFFSTKCLTKCGECAISKPIPQKWKYVEDRELHLSIDIEKNRQTNVENDARWLPVICLTSAEEPLSTADADHLLPSVRHSPRSVPSPVRNPPYMRPATAFASWHDHTRGSW